MSVAGRPRVVLVEDDAALRRFVELALDELDLELVPCTCLAEGLAALSAAPADVVVTDLGLKGESGFSLLEQLARDAPLRAGARIIVFSAGLTPAVQARLARLPVWRSLAKPVALHELERTVLQAVAAAGECAAPPAPLPAMAPPSASPDEATLIAANFNGDAQLYHAFREVCLQQFVLDAAAGDAACVHRDWSALRRVAHNLKTVLRSLGHLDLGDLAAAIEHDAEAPAGAIAAAGHWQSLSVRLLQLAGTAPRA